MLWAIVRIIAVLYVLVAIDGVKLSEYLLRLAPPIGPRHVISHEPVNTPGDRHPTSG